MKYLFAFVLWLSAAVAWAEDAVPLGDVFTVMFLNRAPSTAVPTNIGGSPAIDVYEEGSATPITAADGTFTVNYGSVTGLAHCELTCSSENGFEVGKWYNAVISGTTPTSDSVSIAGTPVARFRIMAAEAAAGEPLTTVDGANSTGLLTAANIQSECEDALAVYMGTTTRSEPTGVPGDTPTILAMIQELYATMNYKSTQTATEYVQYRADGTTVRYERTTSDDGTVFTKGEARTAN